MALYVRVNCNYFTHRKTKRLESVIGEAARWVMPRLWAYAAENQPDGDFSQYSAAEIGLLIDYKSDPDQLLSELLRVGYMDADPLRIHAWQEYNGYHVVYSERARKAANARWQKESSKEKRTETETEKRGEEASNATSNATSIPKVTPVQGSPNKGNPTPEDKMFPSEREKMIKDIKALLRKAPHTATEKIDAWFKKLCALETAQYGYPATEKPQPKKNPQSQPSANPIANYTKEEWGEWVAGMREEVNGIQDRNAGTYNKPTGKYERHPSFGEIEEQITAKRL